MRVGLTAVAVIALVPACDHVLDIPDRITAPNVTCEEGACGCNLGWADCNEDLQSDGCEVRIVDDPSNCGQCGHDCLGGACEAEACSPVVVTSEALVVDSITLVATSTGAFFGTPEGIMRVTLQQSAAPSVELVVALDAEPQGLVAFEDAPIWADDDGIHSDTTTLLPTTAGQRVTALQLSDGILHYAIEESAPPHRIGRLTITEPADATELVQVPEPVQAVAGDDDGVYWLAPAPPARLGLYDLTGGPHDTMLGSSSLAVSLKLVILPDELLYSRTSLGGFQLARSARTVIDPRIDDRVPTSRSFTLFDERVIYSDNNGTVSSVPLLEESGPALLASAQDSPTLVTANDQATFWLTTAFTEGTLRARVVYVATPLAPD